MATLNENVIVQRETKDQGPTLQSGVEISQKNQALDEVLLDSKKDQEMLTIEQNVQTESQALQQGVQIESQALQQGAKTESQTLQQGVQIESQTLQQGAKTESQTLEQGVKTESQTLEQGVKTQDMAPKALSDKEIAKIKDNITLKTVANERIKKCEDLMSGIQSAEGSGKSRAELKEKMGRAIKDMKKMIKDIERMEKKGQYYSNTDKYKNRLGEIIFDYYSSREPARQDIVMGIRVPMIRGTTDSKRDANKDKSYAKNNAEYQMDLSEIKKNAAIYTMIGVNANEWGDYCDFIGEGGIAIGHPVYIQHTAGFNQVRQYNPDLYSALTPEGRITYDTYCQRDPARYQTYCKNNNIVCRQESFASKAGKGFADMLSHAFPGIDSDPRKKQAWTKAGGILAIGGAAIMGFKFFKNLFSPKKENEHKWRKAAGRGAGLLALLNIGNVEKRIEDAFNFHPAEKSRMLAESFSTYGFPSDDAREMADRYVGAPVATLSALHFIPIYELESEHILEDKNGDFSFNYNNYETYVNKYSRDKSQKEQVLKAGKKLDNDKSVSTGLKAFGITTREKLRSLWGSDKKKTLADTDEVKNGWKNMTERVSSGVNAELYNNGLRVKNPDDVDRIMKEYEENKDSKKVNEMILGWMKEGLLEFSENKEYTMDEMFNNSNIDLENMTMRGFKTGTNEVKFNSYGELFDTVYLTNKIKYKFSGVQSKSEEPFKINSLGQLKFDDKNWYDFFSGDTTVVSRKTFTNDFPTLKENQDYYVSYLNSWWKGDQETIIHQNRVDLSRYQILKNVGIDFVDANEAHKSEQLLATIKYELRNREKRTVGDAFEIKTTSVTNKTTIEFITRGGQVKKYDISDYPTLIKNKERLLQYINNPSNKMRGLERPL